MSLSLAPVTSASAAMQMHGGAWQDAAETAASENAMSDCMKAMQGKAKKNCACCDTQSKGACPDAVACLAKCGSLVLAILAPELQAHYKIARLNYSKNFEKPPDWANRPPAPPPKF